MARPINWPKDAVIINLESSPSPPRTNNNNDSTPVTKDAQDSIQDTPAVKASEDTAPNPTAKSEGKRPMVQSYYDDDSEGYDEEDKVYKPKRKPKENRITYGTTVQRLEAMEKAAADEDSELDWGHSSQEATMELSSDSSSEDDPDTNPQPGRLVLKALEKKERLGVHVHSSESDKSPSSTGTDPCMDWDGDDEGEEDEVDAGDD